MIHIQRQIRRQHAHQRDIFKIQPLGHHLGADEDGDFFLVKFLQYGLVPGADGVGVHPQNGGIGEQLPQLLLHPLSAEADMSQMGAALRACLRRLFRIAAVVAHQPPVGAVVRQIHAAPGAFGDVGTLRAQQLAAAAPPVQKQDALLPGVQIFL